MTETPQPEPLINPDEVTEVVVLPLTPIEPKPFAKFTQVVNALTTINGLDSAMAYAKFHYEPTESVEENINRISDMMEEDL